MRIPLRKMASLSLMHFLLHLLFAFSSALAQSFYVAAPNTIRLAEPETVAVAHDDPNSQRVTLFLQDHPRKNNTFSNMQFEVPPDKSEIVRIQVRPEDVPEAVFTNPNFKNYVVLVVQSGNFNKEVIIPITSKSGYIFIQTDKPIYTPKQIVYIRVIPLTEKTLPSDKEFKLQIRNPQNIVVKEDVFNKHPVVWRKAFLTRAFRIPSDPLLGEWSVSALHGSQFQHDSSVKFEVREYVLPTFSLKLEVPEVILPNDEEIRGKATATFFYGKKVEGYATFKFGLKGETGTTVYLGVTKSIELADGIAEFRVSTDDLKNHRDIGWFPQIGGNSLVVEVTVTDSASGNQEVIRDDKGIFSESPFAISFKRCMKDFRPGLVSVIEADVTYINGRPAVGIPTTISAVADGNSELNIANPDSVSDEDGRVTFWIHPEVQHSTVTVTLRTNATRFRSNQAIASHTQQKFVSRNNGYIAISRRSGKTVRPGSFFAEDIFIEPPEISDVYYMVVSRGAILLMRKLPKGNFRVQKVEFLITYDMVPSFRLIVFGHYRDELIADSLKVDVADVCSPNAQVTIEADFVSEEPGSNGKIIIQGLKNTIVGFQAVDEAVYSLRNKDLLTKSKVFETMENHDLGCGPGGGSSTDVVLGKAGVVIMTNAFSPPEGEVIVPACEEKSRRKREIVSEMPNGLSATANRNRIIRSSVDELEFVDPENEGMFDENIAVRKDFRETWIFDDKRIGPDNREEIPVSLPHRITTWVIQAVSVSSQYGMCVSEPKKVVAFQKAFLQLNLPYSVVRNEQVEIQAVVFNYGARRLPVTVYMYGVKHICSGAREGGKSESKRIFVEPNSASSVAFPISPLKTGEFEIKVTALSPERSDVIIRKLNVVPEGYTVEKNIEIKLDPRNQLNRKRKLIETISYSDFIAELNKFQTTAINLSVPEDFIPGSDSCTISAIGHVSGPTVETSLQNPDRLLLRPIGSGEDNMIFLGPIMYTVRYLKVTGKMTNENKEKGYGLIREGYQRQLTFRKEDGSYSAYGAHRPSSVWLTAFVAKVLCQASALVYIDEEVMCSGLKWLVDQQQPDGSFIDDHPVLHRDMTGGVVGNPELTAFVLIVLEECNCGDPNFEVTRDRAMSFLEGHVLDLKDPLPIAIAAYALALSHSTAKEVAFRKLQSIEMYNEDLNALHWETGKGTQDIEVTSYALLTYLLRNDITKSSTIVNWLNTKRLLAGSIPSTQDTVMALQALAEYAIAKARDPGINLMCHITFSNDKNLPKMLVFDKDNAHVLQHVKVHRVGGVLFINTEGHGVASLFVKLKYNIPTPPEKQCKFEIKITVTEAENKPQTGEQPVGKAVDDDDVFIFLDEDLIRAVSLDDTAEDALNLTKREDRQENSQLVLNVQICTKYLNENPTGIGIIDAGIFSGFVPVNDDLEKLVSSTDHLIDKYEKTSRSIVFYLNQIPTEEYCFDFRINREFIVENTQMGVVRVYDYYKPEESCSKFYSRDQNSPMLHKICSDGICKCAVGGCPPRKPFAKVTAIQHAVADINEKKERARVDLITMACYHNDYVWKGKPTEITKSGGFLRVHFEIDTVLKEGIETSEALTGDTRELLARDNCESAELVLHQQYLIMGKDGEKYQDDDGNLRYRYLLDRSTNIHKWSTVRAAEDKFLQSSLNFVAKKLREDGCVE